MTDLVTQRNIGALVALVTAIPPESSSGGTINGTAIEPKPDAKPLLLSPSKSTAGMATP